MIRPAAGVAEEELKRALPEAVSLTPQQVRTALAKGAKKIGKPSDYDANRHSFVYGYGRIDAPATLRAIGAKPKAARKKGPGRPASKAARVRRKAAPGRRAGRRVGRGRG